MPEKKLPLFKKLGIWVWVILAIAIILVWRIVASLGKTTKVEAAKVSRGDIIQTVSTSGSVNADKYAVLTFPSGGLVVWVGVTAGQKVSKGQPIAQLDSIPLNAAYQQALNNYRNYQATAENVLDSVKNHSSDESYSNKAARTTAEVNRDNAYDAVLAARENLRNAKLFAPFSGVIDTANPATAGINVIAGAANYTIVDPLSTYFDAEVEETDLTNISRGMDVNIKMDAYPDMAIKGTVETIGMVAFTSSTGGNAYHVRVKLPENVDEKFKVGMGGDADVIYNTLRDVLKVPSSAVMGDTTNFVWVIDSGRAKKIQIEAGGSSIDETEIKSGLTEGTEVISQPPAGLKEGQRIRI